jgi:hypothetical protein
LASTLITHSNSNFEHPWVHRVDVMYVLEIVIEKFATDAPNAIVTVALNTVQQLVISVQTLMHE